MKEFIKKQILSLKYEYRKQEKELRLKANEISKTNPTSYKVIKTIEYADKLATKAEATIEVLERIHQFNFKAKKTLILGPQSSGKTQLVQQITKIYNNPYYITDNDYNQFKFDYLNHDVDLLIVDDITSFDTLIYVRTVAMSLPIDLILVFQELPIEFNTENIFKEWIKEFKIINCNHK